MDKEITVRDYINYFTKNVCCSCKFYNSTMGVCAGEVLPIERAILKNLEGRGCCNDIKNAAELLKEETK